MAGPPEESKSLDCLVAVIQNLEEFVQPRNLENLLDVRSYGAQPQFSACRLHLLVHRDQFAERRAGEILDIREVENDLLAVVVIDEAEQLVPDDLNVALIEDFLVG